MNTPTKLGLYGLGLVVAFSGALGAGRLAGPSEKKPPAASHAEEGGGHEEESGGHEEGIPGGLQVSEAGYRLVPETTELPPDTPTEYRFRILKDGTPVTKYTPAHEKDLHLVVVRRDLSGFRHVHPSRGEDGTWSIPLTLKDPGQYRVFADFRPEGRDEGLTLGVDLSVAGNYQAKPLPAPSMTAEVDGYTVTMTGTFAFTVEKDGKPVTDLQPYLGAKGHLVMLREGDLAYLHVHPDESTLSFHAEVPSAGTYRLYLDFQHTGKVRTAEFTVRVS